MKKRISKYILFLIMVAATITCLTTSTYAFVILNQSVEVEVFNLHIDSGDGLLISLDGVNFSNGIPANMLKEQIVKNYFPNESYTTEEDINAAYNSINLEPVTISQDDNQAIKYDNNNHLVMEKDTLVESTQFQDSELYRGHKMEPTTTGFVTFDLYFKIVGNYDIGKEFKLVLSRYSHLENVLDLGENPTGGTKSVALYNNLTAYDKETGEPVQYGPSIQGKEHIDVNSVDAMRMAVYHNVEGDNAATNNSNTTKANEIVIIENTIGLGSAAIKGRDDTEAQNYNPMYDKNKNAMYTYYNNLYPFSKYPEYPEYPEDFAATDGEAFEDLRTFLGPQGSGNELAKFSKTGTEVTDLFNVLKLSVTIWLEGWDADYFLGSDYDLSTFNIRLKFEKIESEE